MPYFVEALSKQGKHVSFVADSVAEQNKVLSEYEKRGYIKIRASKIDF